MSSGLTLLTYMTRHLSQSASQLLCIIDTQVLQMTGIERQHTVVSLIHRKLSFFPKPKGVGLNPSGKVRPMVLFREAAGHMVQASTACTWMGSAMPNSSIGISSVIPRSGIEKQQQYTTLGTVGESCPRQGQKSSTNWS